MIQSPTITAMMIQVTTTDSFTGIPPNIGIVNTVSQFSSSNRVSVKCSVSLPPFRFIYSYFRVLFRVSSKVMLILRSHFFFVNIFSFCRLYSKKTNFFILFSLSSSIFLFIFFSCFYFYFLTLF